MQPPHNIKIKRSLVTDESAENTDSLSHEILFVITHSPNSFKASLIGADLSSIKGVWDSQRLVDSIKYANFQPAQDISR